MRLLRPLFAVSIVCLLSAHSLAQKDELVIADQGQTQATVVVSPKAGEWEKKAAADLVRYIEIMSGAKPALADKADTVAAALTKTTPIIVVGEEALKADPSLKATLAKTATKNPVLRADAIVLERKGNKILVAGTNDDSHYYAAAELLHRWGCRWYLPTEIGDCIPEQPTLKVGKLSYSYAPPFEVRNYWIAWNGSNDGQQEFTHRNRMNYGVGVPSGHAIGEYVKDLIPKGKDKAGKDYTLFNVPIAEETTAKHIAAKISKTFAAGKDISLGMEDGIYESDSPKDKQLQAGLYDKYFMVPTLTDNFMVLYNRVADILTKEHPKSTAKIGFLAYSNITLPPQRKIVAAKPLVAYLAPIDIDPIHGMDDPKSPPRQEYREMLYRWAQVMEGRVVIYDYDQGMLVWRDIPNPSIQSIRQDIKHYKKAGILGVSTESRGAMATVFLNLHVRGQLYWNPDLDVDALLAEFYEKFYGPAAKPMADYWTKIIDAWEKSIITEHEHFVAPAIYTAELIEGLRKDLVAAEGLVKQAGSSGRLAKQYAERMKFARLGFDVLDSYLAMVKAAATDLDYKSAVAAGERGLAARKEMTKMNPTFTTRVLGVAAEDEKVGAAWWPGEVQQYRELLQFTDGSKGKLVAKTPLEWQFRRDPNDTGLVSGWAYKPVDPKQPWDKLRTDLYMQAQGVLHPDGQSYTGNAWYRTELDLKSQAGGKLHIRFPGLFNECWLYVNGYLVGHREQNPIWWNNDYKFEWDVDLAGQLKDGPNTFVLRVKNPHHFGGMFRRPFVYAAK